MHLRWQSFVTHGRAIPGSITRVNNFLFMSKYKVLVEVEINGQTTPVGSEVELDEATAAPLVEEGKLELVQADEQAAA